MMQLVTSPVTPMTFDKRSRALVSRIERQNTLGMIAGARRIARGHIHPLQ